MHVFPLFYLTIIIWFVLFVSFACIHYTDQNAFRPQTLNGENCRNPKFFKNQKFVRNQWIANEKPFPVVTLYLRESLPVSFYGSLFHAAIKTHIMNHQ